MTFWNVWNVWTLIVTGSNSGEQVTTIILRAVRRSGEISVSFWDALIVEAALSANADHLFTEDLRHGQVIEGLPVHNPFLPYG